MSELLKHLARNLVIGIAAGWNTLGLLVWTNTGGLYDILLGAANPWLPLALLIAGFSLTFGSVAMGASIMMMPYEGDEGKDSGLKIHTLLASLKNMYPRFDRQRALVPVPVKDKTRR